MRALAWCVAVAAVHLLHRSDKNDDQLRPAATSLRANPEALTATLRIPKRHSASRWRSADDGDEAGDTPADSGGNASDTALSADSGDEANSTNATNFTPNFTPQDRLQPMVEAAADGQPCDTSLVLTLEAAWVSACFNWDNTDPNLHSMLAQWINYPKSELTRRGYAEVCVQAEPCIDAVHAYYNAFVEEGCAERLNLKARTSLR
jgi:hypothetical protein